MVQRPAGVVAPKMSTPSQPEFMTDKELAAWLRVGTKKLQTDRAKGEGPPFVKVGRAVRYRRSDVETWLAAQNATGA